jgi:hypothetical protein
MSLTIAEAFADIAPLVTFADKAKTLLSAIPPKDQAKPSDYIKAVAAILNEAAPIADLVADQVKS